MLTISLIPSKPPYNVFKTFTVDSDDIYGAYRYIDTNECLYREDEGIYSNLGENYKDYYVLEYDTFYALVKPTFSAVDNITVVDTTNKAYIVSINDTLYTIPFDKIKPLKKKIEYNTYISITRNNEPVSFIPFAYGVSEKEIREELTKAFIDLNIPTDLIDKCLYNSMLEYKEYHIHIN